MQETGVWFLGQDGPLEEEMAIYSSILVWKIPWTEEPGGLLSLGSQWLWPLVSAQCIGCTGSYGPSGRELVQQAELFSEPSLDLCMRAQSWPTLRNPMDCSPPGSSVHGIFQTRTLEWVATSLSRGSSWPRDWTHISCLAGRFFTCWVISIAHKKILPIGFLCPQLHHTWGSKKSWQQCMISLVVIRSSNKKVEWSN